jgi:hypothetical protein
MVTGVSGTIAITRASWHTKKAAVAWKGMGESEDDAQARSLLRTDGIDTGRKVVLP